MFIPGKEGACLYDLFKQAEKSGGHLIPELESPYFPEDADYIWKLWVEMQFERDNSLSIQGLKVRDIMGYANALGLRLCPFEIDFLRCIDREYVKAHGHRKS